MVSADLAGVGTGGDTIDCAKKAIKGIQISKLY